MEVVSQLFAILAPVFILSGIGYYWARSGRPFDSEMVMMIVTYLATPCLIFSTLSRLSVSPAAFGQLALAAVLCGLGFAVIGRIALLVLKLPAHSYLPALMFPNTGNLGLPLCLFAFGEAGLALAIAVFTVNAVGQFTLGAAMASGEWSIKRLLHTPIVYALIAGLAFMLSGVRSPDWLYNTTSLMGAVAIPLMVTALGVSLAQLKVNRLPRALALSLLRLGGGFAIGLLVAWALQLDGAARGVMIIQASMPTAVFNYLFAIRFKREPADVAGMVVITTLLTFAMLPLLLLFVLPS
ncbi:MAG: AEC family transporter [Reyranellaceae bacterium]